MSMRAGLAGRTGGSTGRGGAVRTGAVLAAGALLVGAMAACGSGDDDESATASGETSAESASPTSAEVRDGRVDCRFGEDPQGTAADREVTVPESDQPAEGTAAVTFTINGSEIPLTLDRASAPCTVAAVVSLVDEGYYNDTPCHRITVPQGQEGLAVLQCGDPTGTGTGGPGFTIQDEQPTDLGPASMAGASLYPRGTVAMAKTAMPDSAGSQFFLVYADSALPPEYAVLGTVDDSGLAALDAITDAGARSDDPSDPDNQVPRDEVLISEAVVD